MPIKKVSPIKPSKAKAKKVVANPEVPVKFPAKAFIFISLAVLVFVSLFFCRWSFVNLAGSDGADPNSWIYSRHKFDQYRADNCGGDPMVTMPECPRTK